MPFATSSFLFLVVRPGAPSSFLLLLVRHLLLEAMHLFLVVSLLLVRPGGQHRVKLPLSSDVPRRQAEHGGGGGHHHPQRESAALALLFHGRLLGARIRRDLHIDIGHRQDMTELRSRRRLKYVCFEGVRQAQKWRCVRHGQTKQ